MVGHYLLTLTKAKEDRLLTMAFGSFSDGTAGRGKRCMVQTAEGICDSIVALHFLFRRDGRLIGDMGINSPGGRYERLCCRFGTERINEAIRSRVLCNQLRRSLAAVRATAGV